MTTNHNPTHPTNQHWCPDKNCGPYTDLYCKYPHPENTRKNYLGWCTRLIRHNGKHAGYIKSITTPEHW